MKRHYKYMIVAGVIALVAACMEITRFTHPDTAPVNSEVNVEIAINVNVNTGIDSRSTLVVGILAPSSWDMASCVVTYSSANMRGGPYTNMPMRLSTAADIEPGTEKEWNAALMQKIGSKGNFESVQWTTFIAETNHNWQGGDSFSGTLNIKFRTGSENLKVNLAYFIGNSQDGLSKSTEYYLLQEKLFETTGGSNPTIDYTVFKMCHVTPTNFTWEDIVRFNFDASVPDDNGGDSPLKGADKVYFMSTATLDGGTLSKMVQYIDTKTRMENAGTDKWFIYMYPHEYFSIPAGTPIESIHFYMVNEDKSIEVRMPNGEEFTISENCQ